MEKIKVMCVFGTRPEAIKMAPVVMELSKRNEIEPIVVLTGQHREMLDQVMSLFKLSSDNDLNIMQSKQTLTDITVNVLSKIEPVLIEKKPDILLVQGDTTTAFIASLAAFYNKIPVGHIEAGLRTDNKYDPFPEEMNRRLASVIADLHFAPTAEARQNLLNCGISDEKIYLTGNTVVDALYYILKYDNIKLPDEFVKRHKTANRIIFTETHRRENLGEPMEDICKALKKLASDFEDIEIVFSVHKNPLVRDVVYKYLKNTERVILLEPVDYPVMIKLMEESFFVLTDSGGLQEEAPSLGKPVLVLRKNTERPEGIRAGTARLVGTNTENVYNQASLLLKDKNEYELMAKAGNPYGDGLASERIVDLILASKGKKDKSSIQFFKG